jgi:hypothetical protein
MLTIELFLMKNPGSTMPYFDEPNRPMTLGSMRRHGVRGLFVTCQHCGHERAVNMDDWPDDATLPSFGPRMRRPISADHPAKATVRAARR